jgi:hypothetical protein
MVLEFSLLALVEMMNLMIVVMMIAPTKAMMKAHLYPKK